MAKRPTQQQIRRARRAGRKPRRNRSAEEKAALRAVYAFRHRGGGGAGSGTGVPAGRAPTSAGVSFMDMFGDLLEPMSSSDIQAQAQAAAAAEVASASAGIGGAMRSLQDAQRMALAGVTQAGANLGHLSGTVGPGIAAVYNQAAQTQGNLASGFSGRLRDTVAGQAAADQAFLQNVLGAPAGQVQAVNPSAQGDAGNVLMGQAGLIPATALGQQGAAFGAYGATLPATVQRMAQGDMARLASQFSSEMGELSSQQAEIAARLPAIQAEHQARLESQNMDRIAMAREIYESDRKFQMEMMAAEQAMLALGMDQAEIDEEKRRWELERQDELDQFAAEMEYQRERDEAEDAQRAADTAAARSEDRNDARADRAERLAKMRRARVDLWDAATVFAKDLRIEVERPSSGSGGSNLPGLGGGGGGTETVRIRPGWNRAMNELRKEYFKEIRSLRRMGVKKTMINKILSDSLKQAGYRKRRRRRRGNNGPNLNPMASNYWGGGNS